MTTRIELKQVSLKDSVQFHGPSDMTLISTEGARLFLDTDLQCIIGENVKRADPLWIPLTNVKSCLPLTDAAVFARSAAAEMAAALRSKAEAEAAARTRVAEEQAALPPEKRIQPKRGVTKFVKNAETGQIEEKQV